MVRQFPLLNIHNAAGGARRPSFATASSHCTNTDGKPWRKAAPGYVTRNGRSNCRMQQQQQQQQQNHSFQNSIVFLKRKTAQAVLLQASVRGFLARQAFQKRMAAFQLEQTAKRKISQQNESAALIQSVVRGMLCRHQFTGMLRRHQAITRIQAAMRGMLQRVHWLTSHKISLRLVEIEREQNCHLEKIERDKQAKMEALDQQLEDFYCEQQKMQKQKSLLDKQTQDQGSVKDQLRRENRRMRRNMDKLSQKRKEIQLQSRRIGYTVEVAARVKPELKKTICQLERSIQKRKTTLSKLDSMEKNLVERMVHLQDKIDAEKRQNELYCSLAARILQQLEERCPTDRLLLGTALHWERMTR